MNVLASRPERPVIARSQLTVFIAGRGLPVLAVLVGVGAGLGAVAFRYMIEGATWLFTGHLNLGIGYDAHAPWLPSGAGVSMLLAPVVGGLLYGPIVSRFASEARGHGVPEVMLAVARRGGRIRPRVALVKAAASAICIGSGGSVGREGPIVQVGSALGSTIGQITRMPDRRIRLLVACGAAGGIAATFNAPIAGVFFALEVIIRDFEADSFAIVVLSSVAAAAIGRLAFGSGAFLHLPQFHVTPGGQYVLFAVLGVVAAFGALSFVTVLYEAEDLADRLWRGPEWLRPAVGGVLLGGLLLLLPQMYGVGYPVLEGAVRGHYAIGFLAILFAGKIAATSLTLSIGGSGGVFAPSLFLGAMLGSGFGEAAHSLLPGTVATPGLYGVLGMAAVFAAAARAPITAVLIIFELTGDYGIVLPVLLAVGVAVGIAGLVSRESIYTRKLARRGVQLGGSADGGAMHEVSIASAMRSVPPGVPESASAREAAEMFADSPITALPVIAADGSLVGVIGAQDVELALADEAGEVQAVSLARTVPELRADEMLETAARALAMHDESGLPVLEPAGRAVAGWITHADVLRAYGGNAGGAHPVTPPP